MRTVDLTGKADFAEWRDIARLLLSNDIPPQEVHWRDTSRVENSILDGIDDVFEPSLPMLGSQGITVPKSFLPLAEAVICHSDPARFTLLYRLLWRLQGNKKLLEILSDEDVVAARAMEKSVHRDSHKMKAFVRFKEVAQTTEPKVARRQFLAWFEPDHFIVERVAPFFQRRFTDMDWIIATPKGSAAWDGQALKISSEPAGKPLIEDATDDLWRTYYANVFNPARLKVRAMQAEMPKKYWKNLPEAELIPGLVSEAEAKVAEMRAKQATQPPAFHMRLQAATRAAPQISEEPADSVDQLRHHASDCRRCDLYKQATQTVFGEGPDNARIMFVGEQPGDQEDLAGRPFVGPAGKMFDSAMEAAGLDRSQAYVTNAVKHFKFTPRGKRRIHQKPNMGEIRACHWWLKHELELIKPKLVVALGATALAALMEKQERLSDFRGKAIPFGQDQQLFVTVHPSYLLRIPDPDSKKAEIARFSEDMRLIKKLASG